MTQKTIDAYTAAWDAQSVAQLGRVYARDVVFDCHATGVHVDGRDAFLELMGAVISMTTSTRALAGHAGRGWGVLELRQDVAGGSMQILQLIETRGRQDRAPCELLPARREPSEPAAYRDPLGSPPGPADTPAAAEAVALEYAAALQAKDADADRPPSALPRTTSATPPATTSPAAGELRPLRQDLQGAGRPGLHGPPLCLRSAAGRPSSGLADWPSWPDRARRRDHARDPRRQDRPRDALLQQRQDAPLIWREGRRPRPAPSAVRPRSR